MASIFVHIQVRDFDQWKQGFKAGSEFRLSNGMQTAQVFTEEGNPHSVFVLFKWKSMAEAQKFMQSAELKTNMQNAGVEGAPHVHFLNEA